MYYNMLKVRYDNLLPLNILDDHPPLEYRFIVASFTINATQVRYQNKLDNKQMLSIKDYLRSCCGYVQD